MRGGGGFSFFGKGSETGNVAFRVAGGRFLVCAVSVSSSLVSSDGALTMDIVDLDSQAERMANSDWLITTRIWIAWKNAAPFLVSGSGAAFNYRRYIFKQAGEEKSLSLNF